MHSLDFNAQTAFISGRYMVGNWQFSLGGNYTRLLNQSDYDETYNEFYPPSSSSASFPSATNFCSWSATRWIITSPPCQDVWK
ncbi:MAG: hypothetical protein WDN00_17980 [Limisphaerales bacterium]